MSDGRTIEVTCGGCRAWDVQRVDVVLVTDRDGVLLLMWPCTWCGPGWQVVENVGARALVLASGAAVRRASKPTGWPATTLLGTPPSRPETRPRPAPLSRLARLVNRRIKPTQGD